MEFLEKIMKNSKTVVSTGKRSKKNNGTMVVFQLVSKTLPGNY